MLKVQTTAANLTHNDWVEIRGQLVKVLWPNSIGRKVYWVQEIRNQNGERVQVPTTSTCNKRFTKVYR